MMAKTFKALSALLSYPDEDLRTAIDEIGCVIRSENLIDIEAWRALEPLLAELARLDLFDLQERYVDLFDKTRRLSLHLFEHVHGESRDRGQAMVDLAALYEKGGLTLEANELPDYLPLFLEYLSTLPIEEARPLLANALHIVSTIEERLAGRNSAYAAVFSAIGTMVDGTAAVPAIAAPTDAAPDDLAALDAAWEETAVSFGPGDATDGCSIDRLRIQIRAGRRDARQSTA
ncbi:nitrate reductase molybdenum cofactor assembly chaperone [Hyphomicrobium sp. MC1]|uniref:nitrate reductase molybdenum cofactor assembly chaperone n=1 Tax=Hyphomicrobium sp. (strain MC1) TaxID=717785 RepID=UPI000213E429|nr:nitrate reductase molybdenum cofactor assembly chaperone [Hyphomicrobium sp. MC1]CCB66463.1 Nitrate reductase molybdenum cofactor assembly chaperone NarJ [Hyphomicrobium sp. MC1]